MKGLPFGLALKRDPLSLLVCLSHVSTRELANHYSTSLSPHLLHHHTWIRSKLVGNQTSILSMSTLHRGIIIMCVPYLKGCLFIGISIVTVIMIKVCSAYSVVMVALLLIPMTWKSQHWESRSSKHRRWSTRARSVAINKQQKRQKSTLRRRDLPQRNEKTSLDVS